MTSLTLVALGLIAWAVARPARWPLCLALAGLAPAGVAVVAGAVGVPLFFCVGLAATAVVALRLAAVSPVPSRLATRAPGVGLLAAFGVWATVVTVTAPVLFPGLPVLGSSAAGPTILAPGVVTSSNLAQTAYFWVGLAVIVLVASSARPQPYLAGVTALGIVGLSFVKYLCDLAGAPFPADLFDNNPSWAYIETAPGGAERFRGILSEPASLATYCLAAAAFATAVLPRARPVARVGLLAGVGACVWLGIASTSTTFVVAGCLLGAAALARFAWSVLAPGGRLTGGRLVVVILLVIVAFLAGSSLSGFVNGQVAAKSGSDSGSARSGVDAYAWWIAVRTDGLGVGLGSNRPSSFAAMLLSNVGVVGTLLFAAAVIVIVRRSLPSGAAGPTLWVLGAVLAAKLVSGPDLADPSGLTYLTLGVLAGLGTRVPRTGQPPSSRPLDPVVSHA